ncbi:hypothetical protein [uncultured Aquitalea sp.]|uniref:hypothetical protein n=1 Tax=uncultured Aquitalea sp. TaxID=540272 RepID=UPI0025EE5591|nr:hypothetical protein [uncultured Aquitalea sp.]
MENSEKKEPNVWEGLLKAFVIFGLLGFTAIAWFLGFYFAPDGEETTWANIVAIIAFLAAFFGAVPRRTDAQR